MVWAPWSFLCLWAPNPKGAGLPRLVQVSVCVHLFHLSACAMIGLESLSICPCPRNQYLILVWKKYHEIISIHTVPE